MRWEDANTRCCEACVRRREPLSYLLHYALIDRIKLIHWCDPWIKAKVHVGFVCREIEEEEEEEAVTRSVWCMVDLLFALHGLFLVATNSIFSTRIRSADTSIFILFSFKLSQICYSFALSFRILCFFHFVYESQLYIVFLLIFSNTGKIPANKTNFFSSIFFSFFSLLLLLFGQNRKYTIMYLLQSHQKMRLDTNVVLFASFVPFFRLCTVCSASTVRFGRRQRIFDEMENQNVCNIRKK